MRTVALAILLAATPSVAVSQVNVVPSRLAEVEIERSRTCVNVLADVSVLNQTLEPLVARGQRLRRIAEAVGLEDRSTVEPFDTEDEAEVLVRDWFVTDAALAQRYVTSEDPSVLSERQAGRETIKAVVARAITDVQAQVNEALEENAELIAAAGPCDGAIFVRSAVLEACASSSGALCEQAALPAGQASDFRFVDAAESVWELQEDRPWTVPTPLQPTADGQLGGARTFGFARVGNVVLSASFSPMFRERSTVSAEELTAYRAVNDSLGLSFNHASVAVAPALGIRAALPVPLGTESRYVLHFGSPDAADVVWSGLAGTGAPLETAIPLGAAHVVRLRAGDPLILTALGGPAEDEVEYSIQLTNVNQAAATRVLLNYMTGQMSADLDRFIQPGTQGGRGG